MRRRCTPRLKNPARPPAPRTFAEGKREAAGADGQKGRRQKRKKAKKPAQAFRRGFFTPVGCFVLGADLVEGRRQLRVNRLDRGHPVLAPGDEFGDDEVPREDLHDERDVAQALELFREWSQAFRTGRRTDFRKIIGVPYE